MTRNIDEWRLNMGEKDKRTILIVEDESEVLQINARILGRRGYRILAASNCSKARQILTNETPDVMILDVMLPDGNGFDLCEQFRKTSDNPVVFLTGKTGVEDKIDGLAKGGDYYLTKPYNIDELIAVVARMVERQVQTKERGDEQYQIRYGELSVDFDKARAMVDGKNADLTPKEFAILSYLMKHKEHEVSAHELYESIWGASSVDDTRTVRTHIKNLRKKIKADESDAYDIVSVYGKGYMFLAT